MISEERGVVYNTSRTHSERTEHPTFVFPDDFRMELLVPEFPTSGRPGHFRTDYSIGVCSITILLTMNTSKVIIKRKSPRARKQKLTCARELELAAYHETVHTLNGGLHER